MKQYGLKRRREHFSNINNTLPTFARVSSSFLSEIPRERNGGQKSGGEKSRWTDVQVFF